MEFLIIWLFGALIVGIVASKRGRSGAGYFFLSLIVSPLLVLLLVLLLGSKNVEVDSITKAKETVCPKCKIPYSSNDKHCSQCGEALPEIHSSKYTYKLERSKGYYGDGFILIRIDDNQRLAWQTLSVGEGLISLDVAGTSFRENVMQNKSFEPGKRLLLITEPKNEYDPNAIGIWNSDKTQQVGYIPKEHSSRISKKLNKGQRWHALSMWQTVKKGRRVGLRILMYREGTRLAT